jgi:hypothetical protein
MHLTKLSFRRPRNRWLSRPYFWLLQEPLIPTLLSSPPSTSKHSSPSTKHFFFFRFTIFSASNDASSSGGFVCGIRLLRRSFGFFFLVHLHRPFCLSPVLLKRQSLPNGINSSPCACISHFQA